MFLIQFAHPYVLLLLVAPPLLCAWRAWARRAAVRIPDIGSLPIRPRGRARRSQWIPLVFWFLGLSSLIVAVAGPRWPDEGSRVPTDGVSIGFALDVSGSMAEEDFDWRGETMTRLDAAKKAFALFVKGGEVKDGERLKGRPQDQIGLIVFATRPDTVCPVTLNHQVLLSILDAQKPRKVPTESRTNIGDAIALALNGLKQSGAGRKVLILLSDGEHNVEDGLLPRQAAQLAGNLDVPIYVMDAGRESKQGSKVDDKVDRARAQKILRQVADLTGGKYFAVEDASALLEASAEIDAMERAEIESFIYRRYHEAYSWFALAALAALGIAVFLENIVWVRGP